MAGADDNLGYCGLAQGLCGLVQVFLVPRSGGVLAKKDGRTGSPRDLEIRSDTPVSSELLFDDQEEGLSPVAWNSPAAGTDLCSTSSQIGRTRSSRDVSDREDSPPVSSELLFDDQEEGLSPVARNSTVMGGDLCSSSSRGSMPDVVEISSDEEDLCSVARELRFDDQEEDLSPVVRSSTAHQNGMAGGVEDDDDDDDCVILDCDPHSAVTVKGEKEGSAGDGSSDEELQIVAEKGQVACRDFPHSRHLCSNMPFSTTSHEKHCTMCYCFVCDAPAPCSYWGKGLSVDDHCHATDKDTKWKTLRQAFRQCSNGSGTSNGHTAQISHPLALTVSAPRAHPAAGSGTGTSNAHTAQISHPLGLTFIAPRAPSATRVPNGAGNGHSTQFNQLVEPSVSAPRAHLAAGAGRCTSNGHSAQVSHPLALTVSAPRAHPAAGAGRGTSNAQTSHSLTPTVSGPRASSATRLQTGTSNGHSAQVTHLVERTVSAPRPHPAAGAGRGTRNTHTAVITHPVEPTVSAARTETGTSNAYTCQITHPVEPIVSGTRAYPAGSTGRDISNAHTFQINRPVEQTISGPRVYPGARAGRDSSNAHSSQITYPSTANGVRDAPEGATVYVRDSSNAHSTQITYPSTANGVRDAPEGATVYVRNLPYHIDNERLKLSFQHAGVVLFSKVIYDRETGQSRGFGYVTMNTVQEAEAAVRMYNGSVMYGRPLTVNIAAPRGGARVDTAHFQPGSPLRIFVYNLPTQVNHSRLEELFSKHGKVVDARVIYERRGYALCSRGFGFVTMATEEESQNAIHALNKQVLEGHTLTVKVAREVRPERGCLSHSNQTPLRNAVSQNQNTHTSVRASLNVATSVGVTRGRSGTSNGRTAQVTHQLDPNVSATRSTSGTSNAHNAQVTHPLDPAGSAPRAQESNLDGVGARVANWPPELRRFLALALSQEKR